MARGKKLRNGGHFAEAVGVFKDAARWAHDSGDAGREADALLDISGCRIRLFEYREALESAEASRKIALLAHDNTKAGAASGNLSTIYVQLGDFASANKEADRSVNLLRYSPRKDYFARALLNYGDIQFAIANVEAGRHSYDQAVEAARSARNPSLEAMADDHRGTSLLLEGRLSDSETALKAAFDIRVRIHDEDNLAITKEHLAELNLKKGNYETALRYIDDAFASSGPSFKASPQYYPIRVRGQILLHLHRDSEALAAFREAVDSAGRWRRGALPGDATSIQTIAYLHGVYQDYAELAARLALQRHDPELARQALGALAGNRAAGLREQMTLAFSRNFRLPAHYFELLSQLQETQARVTLEEKPDEKEAKLNEILGDLSDLENKIGLETQNSAEVEERNPYKNSLKDIQSRLSGTEVLLSFCLGKDESFLWAVTGDHVNLYSLPTESEIARQAREFSGRIQNGQDAGISGQALSRDLFGKLPPDIFRKRDWLITADGVLLNSVPFSALPAQDRNATLTASHTLRFLPSELLLASPRSAAPERRFVGIGDPIYNLADSRRIRTNSYVEASRLKTSVPLARLVASDREIRCAAKASGLPDVQLLTGSEATGTALQAALVKKPEVLHFAVHVVSPDGNPRQAALALSLTKENMPELLTQEAIATYRVPGSLVVLSGCSSAQGEILPSAGLIGLSRAWLLAGASAVIVSAWPTPDDSGQFFSDFYRDFRLIKSNSISQRAAAALREVQLNMQRTPGYRSSPSFWAAYSIISKE